VVKEVLNEDVSFEDLGGAEIHSTTSGVADFVYSDEENCLLGVKKLLSYLPSNNVEHPPIARRDDIEPNRLDNISLIIPDDSGKPYDIIDIINRIVDTGSFFEVAENFAQNIVTGFARLDNQVIGIIANQPKCLAGTLDINASRKAARFVRFCDAFNIPILVLEDVPGFMPGQNQEHNAIILHGAKLLYAFAEASVPKITVILRKAYGGAYIVMNSKAMGGDFNFAWPTAEVAVMGPEGAVKILNRKDLANAEDPEALRKKLAQDYKENIANPFIAEEKGFIDEVIDPADTRKVLIDTFALLENKVEEKISRKHGNIPL
jgi:acetyl-CoA carboxylase carboxyltransferase component